MLAIPELSNKLSIAEKYFIERTLEQVNSKTIDTYRARLHNPKTILAFKRRKRSLMKINYR